MAWGRVKGKKKVTEAKVSMATKMSQLEAALSNAAEWEESTNIPPEPHLIVLLAIYRLSL